MKEKALELMREAIEYYYDTKYSQPYGHLDRVMAEREMVATYETLRELGLLTREEYKVLRHEIHDRENELLKG